MAWHGWPRSRAVTPQLSSTPVPFDDDAEEDSRNFRPPPDPDDRLWRHPSEIGAHPLVGAARPAGPTSTASGATAPLTVAASVTARGRPWGLVVAAGATGAALAGAGVLTLGIGERVVERPVVSQVALNTVASLPGADAAALAGGVRERVAPAVVSLTTEGAGSMPGPGIVVRDDGIVLTSTFVLGDAERGASVDVRLGDASRVTGHLVGTDPSTGIGVVELAGDGYPTAVLASAGRLGLGDIAFAAGAGGDGARGAGSAGGDVGVVTVALGTSRHQVAASGGVLDGALTAEVTADAPGRLIGGPLLDGRGAVVGIIAARDRTTIFATPVEVTRRVVDDLLTTGRADHCWLGIEGRDARSPTGAPATTAVMSAATGPAEDGEDAPASDTADGAGALVVTVVPGGPADRAGLRTGDVITAVDGRRVERMADLILALRSHRPGDRAELSVARDDTTSLVAARLGAVPPAAG